MTGLSRLNGFSDAILLYQELPGYEYECWIQILVIQFPPNPIPPRLCLDPQVFLTSSQKIQRLVYCPVSICMTQGCWPQDLTQFLKSDTWIGALAAGQHWSYIRDLINDMTETEKLKWRVTGVFLKFDRAQCNKCMRTECDFDITEIQHGNLQPPIYIPNLCI